MARKFAAVVFSLGCVQAGPLMALGLGEITLDSYLNEPLKAEVDLLNVGGLHEDQIRIRLATADDFKRMGVDRTYFLTSISFDVEIDDKGRARIVLTSEDPVLEPYLDFIVEARWPSGRLLREYTVLVDPPVFQEGGPMISASQRVSEVEEEGQAAAAKKKPETGTRVEVRDSDLPPGSMPQRDFNSTTVNRASPGSRYMVNRDDTLWRIASSARPGGASVHQTMLDIQRLNPDAFIDGNINLIKAGYIIYLPTAEEITTASDAVAVSEVREQNEAWREGRTAEPEYGDGPSLRISAEPVAGESSDPAAAEAETVSSAAALEDLEKAELEREEMEQRLVAMEQQVETLQRIVSLKDDQIAALQGALAEQQAGEPSDVAEIQSPEATAVSSDLGEAVQEELTEAGPAVAAEEAVAGVAEVVEAPAAPVEQTAPSGKEQDGGILDKVWYILGAALLALLAFLFLRRRGGSGAEEPADLPVAAAADDQADQVVAERPRKREEQVEEAAEPVAAMEDSTVVPIPDTRGYGQRKHDEYASDVDANDALAEADIYIAYGRYPQAIDLLENAIVNEPDNASYRLKLLELYLKTGDRDAANQQMSELARINEPGSVAAAERIMAGLVSGTGADALLARPIDRGFDDDLLAGNDESLEADFSGLEIEEPGIEETIADDLDLSGDFGDKDVAPDRFEEDLVIAAESNGLSTKLDLARAYLDMGDDDGARQILEEVAAEGTEDLQAEARDLLDRIA
jgi:pilus assembly protein FimV